MPSKKTKKKSAPRRAKKAPVARRTKRTGKTTTASRGGKGRRRSSALADVSLAALTAEIERRLEDLRRQRERFVRDLEALDAKIAAIDRLPAAGKRGRSRRARAKAGGAPRLRPRNAMNLVEALHRQLSGATLSVTEVAEAVQKAGYRTTSPNFRTIVNQTLINNAKLFKRVARGRYTAK
jgi:hypothetical protein